MHRVLVSAHRGGAGADHASENTAPAFERAIASGCDYVEFDVRCSSDGHLVLHHDDRVFIDGAAHSIAGSTFDSLCQGTYEPMTLAAVLHLLRGRSRAHVDLKVVGNEVAAVEQVLSVLDVGDVIITTTEDDSVRTIRAWSREHAPDLLVGLSSGARAGRGKGASTAWTRFLSWFPRWRLRRSGANLVVAHRRVARAGLKRYARRRGLPLVVWTVDDPAQLRRWMRDVDVWMVATNYPERAIAAREA